jgi:hypothetical protein
MRSAANRLSLLPWVASGIALAYGTWWRDCVLIASSLLLALHAFYAAMDRGSPWEATRCAIRCWVAGVLSMFGAAALLVWVAAFMFIGRSSPVPPLDEALAVLGLAVAIAWLGRQGVSRAWHQHAVAGVALGAAASAEIMVRSGFAYAPCAFAIFVAVAMAWLGRHLAHDLAGALMRASGRH